jgi:DNA repair protein RadA
LEPESALPSIEEARNRISSYPVYSSCSNAIDRVLLGGYSCGRVIEFFGGSNTGKTQLAMQAVLSAARLGARALFIDSEGTFRPERVEGIAEARGWDTHLLLDRIEYLRATDSTQQIEAIRGIGRRTDTASCRVVVIDTLTANFSLDFPGSANMPRRQGALAVHLSEIARDAFLGSRAYVLANRVSFSQEQMGEAHVGGRTVTQMVHRSICLTKEKDKRLKATLAGAKGSGEYYSIGPAGIQ